MAALELVLSYTLHSCPEPAGPFVPESKGSAAVCQQRPQTSQRQRPQLVSTGTALNCKQEGPWLGTAGTGWQQTGSLFSSALDCCCETVSQLVINYFVKSFFFSSPHHYFHLVSYNLDPVIGKAPFSPQWGLGFAVTLTLEAMCCMWFTCTSPALTLLVLTSSLEADPPFSYLAILSLSP